MVKSMNSVSNSPINPLRQGRGLGAVLASQRGAFSPFMYGLIIGVTIFSAVSMQYAKQELVRLQQEKTQRARANAKDIADALDFSVLSETKETYQDEYTLDRARRYANTAGKTEGDENFQLSARESGRQTFGHTAEKIAITASDDSFLRARVNRTATGAELEKMADNAEAPLAVYDTSGARERQILTSNTRMEALAEQLYAYYAANLKFPDRSGFDKLNSALGLKDAWGENFTYDVAADRQSAKLAFTTPWNYERTLNLNLKDGTESAK